MNPRQATQAAFIFALRCRLQRAVAWHRKKSRTRSESSSAVSGYRLNGRDNKQRIPTTYYDAARLCAWLFTRASEKCDAAGRQASVTDPMGRVATYTYDALGRVISTTHQGNDGPGADDVITQTIYDALGRREAQIDALGRRTDYEYDSAGRLTAVVLPQVTPDNDPSDRPRYEYGYDAYGNRTLIRDPMDDNLAGTLNKETTFTYDAFGHQLTRTLPLGQTQTSTYNDLGQLTRSIDFEGRVTDYTYDAFGRLATKQYAMDVVSANADTYVRNVTYTYDAFGRIVKIDDSVNGITTKAYNADGQLTQIASPQGILNYAYDPATDQRIRTWTSKTTAANDAITDTRYSYDALGRLKTVSVYERNDTPLTTPETTTYGYNADGTSDYQIGSNGITEDISYDALGRPDELTDFIDLDGDHVFDEGSETLVAQFQYEYDLVGNRTQSVETFVDSGTAYHQKFTWSYDGLNRLVTETFDQGNNGTADSQDYITRFSFDLDGNRLMVQKDSGNANSAAFTADVTTTYTYDANHRLLSENKTGPDASYTEYSYGADGTATAQTAKTVYTDASKTTKVSQTTYVYNAKGRMSSVQIDSDGDGAVDKTIEYRYNDSDLRIASTENGVTTLYHFDPNNPTGYAQVLEQGADTNGDGRLDAAEINKSYVLGKETIAQQTAAIASGMMLSFLYDLHGSTRALTDETGAIYDDSTQGLQAFTYDAYGELIPADIGAGVQSEALTELLYSGEFTSAATGLQYLRARYYSPSSGTFTRFDPIAGNRINNPLSLNKYLYANGNPVIMSDPSGKIGLISTLAVSGISAGIFSVGFKSIELSINFARGSNYTYSDVASAYAKAFGIGFVGGAVGSSAGLAAGALGKFFTHNVFLDFGPSVAGKVANSLINVGGKIVTGATSGMAAAAAAQFTRDISSLIEGKFTFKDELGRLRVAGLSGVVTGGIIAVVSAPLPTSFTSTVKTGEIHLEPGGGVTIVPISFSEITLFSSSASTVYILSKNFLSEIINNSLSLIS